MCSSLPHKVTVPLTHCLLASWESLELRRDGLGQGASAGEYCTARDTPVCGWLLLLLVAGVTPGAS